jgi:hypothetical protein
VAELAGFRFINIFSVRVVMLPVARYNASADIDILADSFFARVKGAFIVVRAIYGI